MMHQRIHGFLGSSGCFIAAFCAKAGNKLVRCCFDGTGAVDFQTGVAVFRLILSQSKRRGNGGQSEGQSAKAGEARGEAHLRRCPFQGDNGASQTDQPGTYQSLPAKISPFFL
ncbi:hypothetical protein Amal_03696 [Acetobacter malorum]|uniref:Uncharacterized protein n=1 Tax=Acetobacter malorum TaxID=178901 RepID=A0A177G451_9PROT|nr:hypothetical protein Amal_03696 [Acetobacter malorum]